MRSCHSCCILRVYASSGPRLAKLGFTLYAGCRSVKMGVATHRTCIVTPSHEVQTSCVPVSVKHDSATSRLTTDRCD